MMKQKMMLKLVLDPSGELRCQTTPQIVDDKPLNFYMIRVNNPNKIYWDIIIIVLALYNCLETPIEIAFDPSWA